MLRWRAPACVKSAATAAAPRRSCSQRQSLFMQSASAERTVGLLCVLHHPSAWGQHHKNRGESVETLSLPPFSTRLCWKIDDLIKNSAHLRSLLWGVITKLKRGGTRAVNTDESSYWHLHPGGLPRVWTRLKGHRFEDPDTHWCFTPDC